MWLQEAVSKQWGCLLDESINKNVGVKLNFKTACYCATKAEFMERALEWGVYLWTGLHSVPELGPQGLNNDHIFCDEIRFSVFQHNFSLRCLTVLSSQTSLKLSQTFKQITASTSIKSCNLEHFISRLSLESVMKSFLYSWNGVHFGQMMKGWFPFTQTLLCLQREELAVLSNVTDTLWRLVAEVQTKHAEWAVPAGSTGVLDLP